MFVLALFMIFSGFYAHAAPLIHDDSAISVQAIIGNKIDNKGQQPLRSLFDSISRNDKNETDSLRVFLERESQNEQKGFNTMKEELWLAQERNALRRQSDNGEKIVKTKRESNAQGSKQTAVERMLDHLGYKKSWDELNNEEKAIAFFSLAEKHVFHLQIISLTLVRDILEQFKKEYLDTMRGYELKDADSIEKAYEDFFDPKFPKQDYIREMSDELYYFLRDHNQSVTSYIKNQRSTYRRASKFIHTYREYCIYNLYAEECTLLIRMAPKIDSDVKNVVNYLAEKQRQV